MAETFGLIAGLPGLVTSCADLYRLTITARHFDHDLNIIVCMAAVEQMKFAYWLQDVGFVEGSYPKLKLPPGLQITVMSMLQAVKDTLTRLSDLIADYELPDGGTSGPDMALPDAFWRLRITSDQKQTEQNMFRRIFRATTKTPTWAAGQQEEAVKLVGQLQNLNEGLAFVSGNFTKADTDILPSRLISHVFSEDKLNYFIEATIKFEPELARCAEFKQQVLAATASVSTQNKAAGPGNKSPLQLAPVQLSKQRVTQTSRMGVASLKDKATGSFKPVLFENKSYAAGGAGYEEFVKTRVGEIAMILAKAPKPAQMHVLDCAGYIQNRKDKCFSLIFYFPEDVITDTDPISLQKLLPQGPHDWYRRYQSSTNHSPTITKPSLRTRFAIAQSLAHTLSLLQACGVLHKGISPSSILFFKSRGDDNTQGYNINLSRPYVTGFTWARLHGSKYISDRIPSKDFTSTSGLLQAHPSYWFGSDPSDQRYLKAFDLYSLGLVLLQVGLWRSLEDITDDMFPSAKSRINTVGSKLDEVTSSIEPDQWLKESIVQWHNELVKRQRLVDQSDGIAAQKDPRCSFQKVITENIESLLLDKVGDTYTKVVARCITGDIKNGSMPREIVSLGSDEDVPDYITQDAVVRNIIQELAKCNA